MIGPPTGSRASITPCATSSAAASASSRVAKLPIGYPDSLNEYVGLTSTMVYSQTHVSSSFRVDHKWIDRPLYLDSVSTFPPSAWTSEIWLAWVCKSRQRSACIDAILHLPECEASASLRVSACPLYPPFSRQALHNPSIRIKYMTASSCYKFMLIVQL
jgi:hypothetical protein